MKVLLLFPPQAQPFLPHLALPSLSAYLRAGSTHEVSLMDLNLSSYEYFLSPEFLSNKPDAVFSLISEALGHLRSGEEYLREDKYYWSTTLLTNMLREIGMRHEGTSLDLKDFRMEYRTSSSEQVLRATRDYQKNPYIEFFEKEALPAILEEKPELIGISVSWPSQIIPAFTLGRLLVARLPAVHVTMGGSMITHLGAMLAYKRKLFSCCHSFIVYEGEVPLLALADAVAQKKSLHTVPGIIFPEGKKHMGTVAPPAPLPVNDLPTPDFQGLPLGRYFSPKIYLPLSASRGCYWNRCAFCNHSMSLSSFRMKKAARLIKEMESMAAATGASHFYFVDDAVPPAIISGLAELLPSAPPRFHWGGEVRFDKSLERLDFEKAAGAGCRFLLYGMESSCQRVLDLMRKGYDHRLAAKILSRAHRAGILNWIFLFLGFPGEKPEEAAATLEFIAEHNDLIDMIAPGKFILTDNTDVYRNPSLYGIEKVEERTMDYDLLTTFRYLATGSISADTATAMIENTRRRNAFSKFLKPFVTESHLMFLKKAAVPVP
ncbi:MAG: radical SAM protein [Candidatus Eremiobacteraeota bacterium]|nr:radical SAM protein [Candidatus Eremiobacteraeota bacterium]